MSLEYICGPDTKVEDIKKWIKEQVDITIQVDTGEYDEHSWREERIYKQVPVVEYFIQLGKYDVAEYFMELGAEWDLDMILQAKDIDFIKKHIDITKPNSDFYECPVLMNYLYESNMLDGTLIYNSLVQKQNNKENLDYLHKNIQKLTVKQLLAV